MQRSSQMSGWDNQEMVTIEPRKAPIPPSLWESLFWYSSLDQCSDNSRIGLLEGIWPGTLIWTCDYPTSFRREPSDFRAWRPSWLSRICSNSPSRVFFCHDLVFEQLTDIAAQAQLFAIGQLFEFLDQFTSNP